MRVLVLSNMYPPHHLGGYELSCRDVVDRWRAAGHDVTVLTTDFRLNGAPKPATSDVAVRRTLEWYWRDHAFLRPSPLARLGLERRNQRRLHDAMSDSRPDVVSVWHMGGMSMGLLAQLAETRVPLVYVVCDEWPSYAPDADAWMSSWSRRPGLARLCRILTRTPTRLPEMGATGDFCFVSDFIRRRVLEQTDWELGRYAIVPSGIDTSDFPVLQEAPDPGWSGRLLCVGRVEPRKGFRTAVEALVSLPGASLQIVGPAEPTHRAELEDLAESLGVSTRLYFDAVPRSQLATLYRESDALLFTSAWQEPFGLVPVEAMACSLPVVACATGGSAEFLVDNTNCLVVPQQDATALTSAINRLAGDPELRARLRAGGHTTAAELTIERYATALEARHAQAASRGRAHTTEGRHSWR